MKHDELISREQAIDALTEYGNGRAVYIGVEEAVRRIEQLQPAHSDNQVHLCDSCSYTYPECPSVYTDVIFGNGTGNDNICACSKYLPSVQHEQHLDEWCDSCKEYDKEKHSCPRWNKVIKNTVDELKSTQPKPCEDAVSRKAVKDGFVEMCSLICPYTEKQRHTMCGSCLLGTAFDVLEATQPVTPKQGTGYWIPVGVAEVVGGESAQWGSAIAYHKCSVCNEQALKDDFEQEVLSDFCPHCGAKMEGVSNESN